MENVIIANIAMEPIRIVHWTEAVNLILAGKATPLEGSKVIKTVHSAKLTIDINRILYVNYYEPVVTSRVIVRGLDTIAAKRNVLIRDNYTCAYCGEYGDTVDHIIPKSNSGAFTYGNLVTACQNCNHKKGNLPLEECGMELLYEPKEFNPQIRLKEKYKKEKKEIEQALALYC